MMTKQERAARKAARAASAARIATAQEETRRVVAAGRCPLCGSGLRRNLALTGWYQCAQFGADGFRADSTRPACGWQGFVS